ncbi:rho GDP-dissociation inhibitor 3 [Dryobates pubescens]|uniref:rho GDP-dissociation inhibitor 3 n=2 Tax=Picidae TaxID=9220 RepID=UPI0023B925A9|nr:rho GDP-dissociation inhibitor 3 [Dryobates pubescens]
MSGGAGAARRRGAGAGGGGQRSRRVCGSRRRRRPAGQRRGAQRGSSGAGAGAGAEQPSPASSAAPGERSAAAGPGGAADAGRAAPRAPVAAAPPGPGGAGPPSRSGLAMLGLDVCEAGGQLLELLWLALCYRDIMADKEGVTLSLEEEEDADVALAYKTPEKKSLQEIQELDPGDESLRKYKQALLGAIPAVLDASIPNVQVTKLTLMCEQAPGPITMDLTGDLEVLQGQAFVLKEGVDYRVKVSFRVNREIVCGLRCLHLTYRRGRPVDRDVFMVGSYAPRAEEYEVVTPAEEAPRGWLARGSYRVRSLVTDDDKTEHLSWEWGLCIKKAWED